MNFNETNGIIYSVFDQEQIVQPVGMTKNIVNIQNKNFPKRLTTVVHKGCNTIWRSFKRSVWRHPDNPFLGWRNKNVESILPQ